ncbi:DUF805 domain-containing protein [Halocynthiibacter sp.]|uniref:DUF805 domain-containing protein n=1 Tax=Halocynthiibacter sp. TaxID=1979210 RepID=UPI003C40D9B6
MTFGQSIKTCLSKYVTFSGRAQRSEYWWWSLFVIVLTYGVMFIEIAVLGTAVLNLIISLALLLPGIAVTVRRLHDLDRSGWWILIAIIPLVGPIILLVWFCTKGTAGSNNYGQDPLGGGDADVFA